MGLGNRTPCITTNSKWKNTNIVNSKKVILRAAKHQNQPKNLNEYQSWQNGRLISKCWWQSNQQGFLLVQMI